MVIVPSSHLIRIRYRPYRIPHRSFDHGSNEHPELGYESLKSPRPLEDPESRSPDSAFQYSYGVDYINLRGIYFLDPLRGLGKLGHKGHE